MVPQRVANFEACSATSSGGPEEVCGKNRGAQSRSAPERRRMRKRGAGIFKSFELSSFVQYNLDAGRERGGASERKQAGEIRDATGEAEPGGRRQAPRAAALV